MEIYENQKGTIKDGTHDVILIISYKESKLISDAMNDYQERNKKKKILKKLVKQMNEELPY